MNIQKPEFIIGNEKLFSEFISELGEEKIIILSHKADPDGIVSAKIINEVIKADEIRLLDYHEIDLKLAEELKKKKFNKAIISDMSPDEEFIKELEKFCEILIIDHHPPKKDFNSKKTTYFCTKSSFCAAYNCYYLFSKIENLEKWDWLVASACISDWCYTDNEKWMSDVHKKYNLIYEPTISGIKKSRLFDLAIDLAYAIIYYRAKLRVENIIFELKEDYLNIGDSKKYAEIIAKEIKINIEKFEKDKIEIRDGYYYEFKSEFPIKSALGTHISEKLQNKTIIIGQNKDNSINLTARRQDGKVDMNKLLYECTKGFEDGSGGGHYKASGGYILKKDRDEFLRRINDYLRK
jgi:single-stranded DNA-specific DHH superfamily exonuclease